MTTPNLIKLAPALSIEERFKIVMPECQRMFRGEKNVLSDSEITALTSFEKNEVWAQYARRISMVKWAHILWIRDIEKEKFCACTCILLLNEALWRMITDEDQSMGQEALADNLATIRKYVTLLTEKIADFFAYRVALPRLQEELYGVPIFEGEQAITIQGFFQFIDDMAKRHNDTIRELCTNKKMRRYFKLIVQDIDSYLVNEPKIEEAEIAKLVDEVKAYAESDVNARLRR